MPNVEWLAIAITVARHLPERRELTILLEVCSHWISCDLMIWCELSLLTSVTVKYVDDVLEIVRKGCEQELTEHIKSTDTTGSIQFTYEEESDNFLPFLDSYGMEGRWNSETLSVSDVDTPTPISVLYLSPSLTGGHLTVTGQMHQHCIRTRA